jgi:hypothetical protein
MPFRDEVGSRQWAASSDKNVFSSTADCQPPTDVAVGFAGECTGAETESQRQWVVGSGQWVVGKGARVGAFP